MSIDDEGMLADKWVAGAMASSSDAIKIQIANLRAKSKM